MKLKAFCSSAATRCFPVLLASILLLAGGCSSDEKAHFSMEERLQASSPEPPAILSVPVLALFTNHPGFGAHIRIEPTPGTNKKPLEGGFLSRQNQFLFAAEAREKRARGREMSFIWNAGENAGYALNDALPGYAPLAPRAKVLSIQTTGKAPGEKVNGHPSTQEKLSVALSDGTESQLTVWRADDLRGLPVRIRSENGTPRFTIDLTDVRMQEPAAPLFEVPRDFTKYDSPKAMFDELFRRESVTQRSNKPRPAFDEEEFQRTGAMRPNL